VGGSGSDPRTPDAVAIARAAPVGERPHPGSDEARRVAHELSVAARAAYDTADHERALQLIDDAEELDPDAAENWARIRGIILTARPAPSPATDPAPPLAPNLSPPTTTPPTPAASTVVSSAPSAAADPSPALGSDSVAAPQRHDTATAPLAPSEAPEPAPAEPAAQAEELTTAPAARPPADEPDVTAPASRPTRPPAPAATTDPVPSPAGPAAASQQFRAATQEQLAPSGSVARIRANLAALQTLRAPRDGRPFTADEQAVLARWSGWGAVPEVFDPLREDLAWARAQLAGLLDPEEMKAAARNTLNAHYTDLGLVTPIWSALQQLGFRKGRVLEPGCGSGNFIGAAPADAQMVGVELEPVTAAIAAALYPNAQIRGESFAQTRMPVGSFDMVVGNVPFGKVVLADRDYNAQKHSIHNHFILKSLRLVAPGGLVALITSRYTMDAANPAARREMAQLADLVAAIRLPEDAHQRAAGTHVVTDLLIFRRREDDYEPESTSAVRVRPDMPRRVRPDVPSLAG
jgi:SAM-dependent methyltransferase